LKYYEIEFEHYEKIKITFWFCYYIRLKAAAKAHGKPGN